MCISFHHRFLFHLTNYPQLPLAPSTVYFWELLVEDFSQTTSIVKTNENMHMKNRTQMKTNFATKKQGFHAPENKNVPLFTPNNYTESTCATQCGLHAQMV